MVLRQHLGAATEANHEHTDSRKLVRRLMFDRSHEYRAFQAAVAARTARGTTHTTHTPHTHHTHTPHTHTTHTTHTHHTHTHHTHTTHTAIMLKATPTKVLLCNYIDLNIGG